MAVYTEVELRCDGIPGDAFGCDRTFFADTGTEARRQARNAGWLVSQTGGKDYCPDHRHLARES